MRIVWICIFSFVVNWSAFSQTNVAGGTVSGTWTAAGSPYLVQGNLLVADGSTLIIQPGVTVNFQANYKIQVSGRLLANGTAADSIRFITANTILGWQGIRFLSVGAANDSSSISYCSFRYGYVRDINGGGVYIDRLSKLAIRHSAFSNCAAIQGRGGAIYMQFSNATITDNLFAYNHSIAGALFIEGGSPLIRNNQFSYNDNEMPAGGIGTPGDDPDSYGAGISCYNSSATIAENLFDHNLAKSYGGGIAVNSGNPAISGNSFAYNHAVAGGGIYCTGSLTVVDNTFNNNIADDAGGGIYYYETQGNPLFDRNTMSHNSALASGAGMYCDARSGVISNNLVANNVIINAGADYQGGGGLMLLGSDSNLLVSNNVVVNNTAGLGGGILFYNSSPKLTNNTIANNSASKGGAIYCNGGSPKLLNTIAWGNTAASGSQVYLLDIPSVPTFNYCDIAGGLAGIDANGNFYTGQYLNNLQVNPAFILPTAGSGNTFDGAAAIWSLSNSSPCKDAGRPGQNYPATDQAGNIRIVNGVVDMGALENQAGTPPTASVSGGGQVCSGLPTPGVTFTFTYGTFPLTLEYAIDGVAQPPVTGINSLQYTIPNAAPGIYMVRSIADRLTVGTGSGSATVTVVRPLANFTINNANQCLTSNAFVFTNTSTTNAGVLSSSWNFGDGSGFIGANANHVYATPGNYVVRLAVAAGGCTDTLLKTVTVIAFSVNVLQDTVRTYLDTVRLNAGAGFSSYQWSTGESTPQILVSNSGWYKVTITNSAGCTASDSSYVSLDKLKVLMIDRNAVGCGGEFLDISMRGKSLTNIIGLQGSITWNASLVRLDTVLYHNAAINFRVSDLNLTNRANGYLTYSWSDASLAGKTAADSARLFTMRFVKVGAASALSPVAVAFSSSPTLLEIDSINLATSTPVKITGTSYINGQVSFVAPAVTNETRINGCDSVVYNNQIYRDSTIIRDTLKFASLQCDSLYRITYIDVRRSVLPVIRILADTDSTYFGRLVQFAATITNGGTSPLIQWYKNGQPIAGAIGSVYFSSTLNAFDTITAGLTSSFPCTIVNVVQSNKIIMRIRYQVSGHFTTPSGTDIPYSTLQVTGFLNGYAGSSRLGYFFLSLPGGPGRNYTIRPFRSNDEYIPNGVSTLDIALIQSHILRSVPFNSVYQWIAADVNKSKTVTALDILFIKRLILGLDVNFPCGSLWAYVDTSVGAPSILHPFPYKDSIRVNNLVAQVDSQDFVGVKLGDVNFDWNGNILRPARPTTIPVTFYYKDVQVSEGTAIRVPLRVKNFKDILGMQFTLNYNSAVMRLQGIENNRLNFQYNSSRSGKIAFIWNDANNQLASIADDEVLMELVFTQDAPFATEDISITSDIAAMEAWDGRFQPHAIEKTSGKMLNAAFTIADPSVEQWAMTPNPSGGTVQLQLQLLKEKHIRIEVVNATGQRVYTAERFMPAGRQQLVLNLRQQQPLPAGVYLVKLSGIDGITVKKLVLAQ